MSKLRSAADTVDAGNPAVPAPSRPDVAEPGQRSSADIAALHAHRVQKARDWFVRESASGSERECPICGYLGAFSPVRAKLWIWCPGCDSRPRHRLLKLWMDRDMRLAPGARVIHFAAEPWMRAEMEARGADYRTADLNDKFEMMLDITAMDLPDASADMIMANHVLEHVDDRAAFAEMYRVLAPGGQAVITVPMIEGFDETYEDAEANNTPELRKLRYGDADHLRWYGRDVRERFAAPGFTVSEFTALEPEASRHALHRGEKIFVGTR